MAAVPKCGQCDEGVAAVARIRVRDYDDTWFEANVCRLCRADLAADTMKVVRTYGRKKRVRRRRRPGTERYAHAIDKVAEYQRRIVLDVTLMRKWSRRAQKLAAELVRNRP
jgi:isocitrate dehydrogenase kinase/phosphatase